jgi:hypothetical protein
MSQRRSTGASSNMWPQPLERGPIASSAGLYAAASRLGKPVMRAL